ncbi:MAG: PLP-dependent aminotransferase family protein [Verrucomicrobiia bacterium]|jgi:2-aminoadipate transaminase
MTNAPRHFSALAKRSSEPPISWLMKLALDRPDLISLAVGFTDNETLPVEEVGALTRAILQRPKTARAALQYGTTIGLLQLRRELLRRWQKQDGISKSRITTDDIVVTDGSQQLLYLVSEVLCDPGDIVIVEDPTYFVYLGIVEAMGIRAVGFDSISYLKSKLDDLKRRRLLSRLKMLYLVTYFQNPTGRTWSLEMRRELLAIVKHYERAAGHPVYIVEDAAYRDLRFEGDPAVAGFKSLDLRNERVIYTNTLTKPFATGFRIGYGILPPSLGRAVLRSKGNHDFGTSNFLQTILARALAEGVYDRHLPIIADGYRRKRDVMMEELERAFGCSGASAKRRNSDAMLTICASQKRGYTNTEEGVHKALFNKPHGGMYVWVELDPGVNTGVKSRLFKRALDAGVLYVPGEMCYCNDPSRPIPQNCMRLSFGAPTIQQIQKGIRLLANALG